MTYYALDYLPYQYLRKARRGRSGRLAVLGQAVKSAGIRNGNVALFSKITHCGSSTFSLGLTLKNSLNIFSAKFRHQVKNWL